MAVNAVLDEYDRLLREGPWSMSRVVLETVDGGPALRIELQRRGMATGPAGVLLFEGVTGLEFKQNADGLPLGLQIIDMTGDGWEDLRYKVTDPEYGIASFWCSDLRIEQGEKT
jgi:hypothetical protein